MVQKEIAPALDRLMTRIGSAIKGSNIGPDIQDAVQDFLKVVHTKIESKKRTE